MTITKEPVELLASAARTASGQGTEVGDFDNADALRLQLDVTAASGTAPTLDVVVEDSLDGTNWNTIGTFAQKTATGREAINVTTPFAERLRARYTIGGSTPSFTFSVKAIKQIPLLARKGRSMPKITAKHFYAGADIATGEEFQLHPGESRDVSAEKVAQLKRDVPDLFDFGSPKAKRQPAKGSSSRRTTKKGG